jgi:hypothetical protein
MHQRISCFTILNINLTSNAIENEISYIGYKAYD